MFTILSPRKNPFNITVGAPEADIRGFHSDAIQKAIDAVKGHSGGIVKLTEGTFEIDGPLRLVDHLILTGMGEKTVLRKSDGFKTALVDDADYGELKARVENPSGFKPGMGIQLYDAQNNDCWAVTATVITGVDGDTIYFDDYLVRDYRSVPGGTVSNACSIISGIGVSDIVISHLTIDGNKNHNESINGCRGGGIYLHKAQNCLVTNVKVENFHGDGISWQITENINIKDCTVRRCANFGLHPGTGSIGTVVQGCDLYENGSDGIFVCWRVQHGVFQRNRIHHNGGNGMNIGHKDTDNCFEQNHIYANGCHGILLRPETELNGPHRNVFKGNTIEDNGLSCEGCGILVDTRVKGIVIIGNIIRDTGQKIPTVGIRVTHPGELEIIDNVMSGHIQGDLKQMEN